MLLAAKAWLEKDGTKKMGRRIMFFLLSAWLHGSVFFCVTTILFYGKSNSSSSQTSVLQRKAATVEVSLQTAGEPMPPTPLSESIPATTTALSTPSPTPTPPPEFEPQESPPEQQADVPISSAMEDPKADEQSKEMASKNSALACDSLAKKPERIVFGDDYVQFIPDGKNPGHIVLHETIHRDGTVIAVNVEQSTMNKQMEDQVIAWAYRSLYRPGEIAGIAVDCDMKYVVSPNVVNKL
jgi:outer membrane biosynthesis protein TonB